MKSMKKIDDSEHYFNQFENDDGVVIGLYRVMFGVRVVVYIPGDGFVPLSLCGGSNIHKIAELFNYIYNWLDTNPKDLYVMCDKLMRSETVRPYGKSNELIDALKLLPSNPKNKN